jgi:hypothetical protein
MCVAMLHKLIFKHSAKEGRGMCVAMLHKLIFKHSAKEGRGSSISLDEYEHG